MSTTQSSRLIEKLAQLARGNLDLVHEAIWAAAGGRQEGRAKLDDIVRYIVENRDRRSQRKAA